jgi:hypothetical protein
LPADSTLSNGVGTFSATLKTAGAQSITAKDTVNASITGTSNTITVSGSGATRFSVTAPASATAEPSAKVYALWEHDNTYIDLSARVTSGVAVTLAGGPTFSLGGELGGLGSNQFTTWSVRGRAAGPF